MSIKQEKLTKYKEKEMSWGKKEALLLLSFVTASQRQQEQSPQFSLCLPLPTFPLLTTNRNSAKCVIQLTIPYQEHLGDRSLGSLMLASVSEEL